VWRRWGFRTKAMATHLPSDSEHDTPPDSARRRSWDPRRPLRFAVLMTVLAVCLLDLRADIIYHGALAETGGLAGHTSVIYELADALDAQRLTAPVAMDWGIAAQVQFLTQGRIRPIEIFGYDWNVDEGFGPRMRSFLGNPDSVYIFHAPSETVFPRRDAFDDLVRQAGKVSTTEQVLRQRDGKPIFLLVRVN
jgi:hypothetical protein